MRKHLPGKTDLIVMASMAVVAAIVFASVSNKDSTVFYLGLPLCGVSIALGLRKSLGSDANE